MSDHGPGPDGSAGEDIASLPDGCAPAPEGEPAAGEDPALHPGTASAAIERTELSWARAGLSLVVVATLLIKHALLVGGLIGLVAGVVIVGAGAAAAALPVRRYLAVDADRQTTRSGAVRAAAATCAGVGLLSMVALLVPEQD